MTLLKQAIMKVKPIAGCVIITAILALTACGASRPRADIQPLASLEPQAAPTHTATPPSIPTALPVEINQPISPISPISPILVTTEAVMTSAIQAPDIPPGSEQALAAAITDLAQHLNLAEEAVQLVSIEAVKWSDTSLGCPKEGYMYAQVITPGYLILLEAEGQQYEYHTDLKTNVVRCEQSEGP